MKKILVFCLLFIMLFGFSCILFVITLNESLCLKIEDDVQQNFFEEKDEWKKAEYLRGQEKALESVKFDDTYFLVFTKKITHTSGRIWIYAYTLHPKQKREFIIKQVSLVANDGTLAYENNNCNLILAQIQPNEIYQKDNLLLTYEISDEWYYKGNKLTLNIEIEAEGITKTISYDVEIAAFYSHIFGT